MGRILAIDYGKKRVGIAVTDPLKIIANRLTTIETPKIFEFLDQYIDKENVETIVVGYPLRLNNEPSEAIIYINPFLEKLVKRYPKIKITQADERYTSKMASQAMVQAGFKKKVRRQKEMIDAMSATIILQSYMEEQKFNIS